MTLEKFIKKRKKLFSDIGYPLTGREELFIRETAKFTIEAARPSENKGHFAKVGLDGIWEKCVFDKALEEFDRKAKHFLGGKDEKEKMEVKK